MRDLTVTHLTAHATLMIQRRGIALEWIDDTMRTPAVVREDIADKGLTLAFRQIPEAGDKWLRVVSSRRLSHGETSPCGHHRVL